MRPRGARAAEGASAQPTIKETRLPAGSFFSFSKKQKHGTVCEAGAECVLSIDARGKWDVIVDKAAEKAADRPAEAKK